MAVTPERTGWRDEEISRRHRLWGVDCKMTDLDWLVLEYYEEKQLVKNAALIEYKRRKAPTKIKRTLQYSALSLLATCSNIPFFVVFYTSDFQRFDVFAGNRWAVHWLNCKKTVMSEVRYVTLMHELRGIKVVPQSVLDNLKANPVRTSNQIPTAEKLANTTKPQQISLFD